MAVNIIEAASATTVILAIAVAAIIVPVPRPKPDVPPEPPAAQENVEEPKEVPAMAPPPAVPHVDTPEHIEDEIRVLVIQLQVSEAKRDVQEIAKTLRMKAGPTDAPRR
jgi:hypothetical protein